MTIISGDIQYGMLYSVSGASITYNGNTVTSGSTFRGVAGFKTFTGAGVVDVVFEFAGGAIEVVETSEDLPVFSDITTMYGMAIEFALNEEEKIVRYITTIYGMAIELIDFPLYAFQITKRIN